MVASRKKSRDGQVQSGEVSASAALSRDPSVLAVAASKIGAASLVMPVSASIGGPEPSSTDGDASIIGRGGRGGGAGAVAGGTGRRGLAEPASFGCGLAAAPGSRGVLASPMLRDNPNGVRPH